MVTLILSIGFGLVALLALRLGRIGEPSLQLDSTQPGTTERPLGTRGGHGGRWLALESRAVRRHSLGGVASDDLRLDEAAFRTVGLRIGSDRSLAFAAALCRAAAEERAFGKGGWPDRAVDRLVRCVEIGHLGRVVEDLRPGRMTQADARLDDGPDVIRALLTHTVRDRLHDALRIQFGLRPFWTWETANDGGDRVAATSGPLEHDRIPARAAA